MGGVLPEPFGPRKPWTEPAGTARSISSTASWPPRYCLVSPLLDSASSVAELIRDRPPGSRCGSLPGVRGDVSKEHGGRDRACQDLALAGDEHRQQLGLKQAPAAPAAVHRRRR